MGPPVLIESRTDGTYPKDKWRHNEAKRGFSAG